jgi:hypothetical protein
MRSGWRWTLRLRGRGREPQGASDYYQRMARFEPRRLLRLAQAGEEVGARAVQIAQEKLRGRS